MRLFRLQKILIFGFLLGGTSLMFLFTPMTTKDGSWTHNILRNWEQFGLVKLAGRLVQNPGGIDVLERPEIYSGHRPFFLYPSFWVGHIFNGAGEGGLPFYLGLTLAAAVSIWMLLSRTTLGLMTACVIAFCPGYVRNAV